MTTLLGVQLFWLSIVIIASARVGVAVTDLIWWSALVGLVTASPALYNQLFRLRFRNTRKAMSEAATRSLRAVK